MPVPLSSRGALASLLVLLALPSLARSQTPDTLPPDALAGVPHGLPDVQSGEDFPRISGELVVEIQNDRAYHAQDRDAELNDLFATIEPAIAVRFSEQLSLQSSLVFEPVEDPEPNESRELDRQGLFAEELYALWESGALAVRAGKFNPRFGVAWDLAPGLFGVDFAEDYEITERVGAGVSYDLGAADTGSHLLSLETFFADTSQLTRSLGRGRSRVRRSDGGPSNTGRLNSYSLTLEGGEVPAVPGLAYNLGFVYQAAGDQGRPERDAVVGLTYDLAVASDLNVELLAEYARQDDADGEAGRRRSYLTASASTAIDDLVLAVSYTLRDERVRDDRDHNDFLAQASVGYFRELGPGEAGFEVGYKLTREENRKISTVGLRASWVLEF